MERNSGGAAMADEDRTTTGDDMNDSAMCDFQEVSVRYRERLVLDGFNLRVRSGEKVVLTGDSGSGKSTVLRCLLGFVAPAAGRVFLAGEELTAATVWRLRRRMAFVPQEPDLGSGTVAEILQRPFSFKANVGLELRPEELASLADRFFLDEALLQAEIRSLSGGEKQRVAIISAILLNRPVMLLDEATSALDKEARRAVLEYFAGRDDLTILAVTHDSFFQEFAHRVVELKPNQRRKSS
jgi:ABC-type multidrug transport system fused ATPase/permease subunit